MTTNNQNIKFELSDGFIELCSERLIITDKAKKDRLLLLIATITSILLALSLIYKWTTTRDTYYSVIAIIILIPNLGLLWKWYKEFRFIESNIKLCDIVNFKLVNIKLSDIKVCLIKTKFNKVRRFKMKPNEIEQFRRFIEAQNIQIIS